MSRVESERVWPSENHWRNEYLISAIDYKLESWGQFKVDAKFSKSISGRSQNF